MAKSDLKRDAARAGGVPPEFMVSVVAGAGAASNIAVTNIKREDAIVSVLQFNIAADTGTGATGNKVDDVADLTSEATVTSDGNIQLSSTATSGDKLVVIWLKRRR